MEVKEAVILSGGQGTRLRSITENNFPKSLTKIKDKPIIEWELEWLAQYGINHAILAIGHLSEKIINHLGDTYHTKHGDIDISYSIEKSKLGTGGAFKLASNYITKKSIYVLNGDIMCNANLHNMNKIHFSNKAKATMMLVNMTSPYGIVNTNSGHQITQFLEKPRLDIQINAGLSIIEHDVISNFPDKGQMEDTIFVELTNKGLFYAYLLPNDNFWMSIDTEKDYIVANQSWNGI